MTTATVSSKGQIAIPKEVRDRLDLKAGTELVIEVQGESLVMKRVVQKYPDWRTMRGMAKGGESLGEIFKELTRKWHEERGATSSTQDILLSHAYQSIIGMGPKAVPLILAQMESEGDDPDQWFWALQVLTGANPVSEDDEGDFQAMARTWIGWARKSYKW